MAVQTPCDKKVLLGRSFINLAGLVMLAGSTAFSGTIQISSVQLYVHDSFGLLEVLDSDSPTYFSTLNSKNEGEFGWTLTNAGANTLSAFKIFVFLDAELDRDENSFVYEFGEFIALALPPGAPVGAFVATSWEIDEPEYVYGNIISNLLAGVLDESNHTGPSGPYDDVSLALGFDIGDLPAGATAKATFTIFTAPTEGLRHGDSLSDTQFWFNGYAETAVFTGAEVPEPTSAFSALTGLAFLAWFARTRR